MNKQHQQFYLESLHSIPKQNHRTLKHLNNARYSALGSYTLLQSKLNQSTNSSQYFNKLSQFKYLLESLSRRKPSLPPPPTPILINNKMTTNFIFQNSILKDRINNKCHFNTFDEIINNKIAFIVEDRNSNFGNRHNSVVADKDILNKHDISEIRRDWLPLINKPKGTLFHYLECKERVAKKKCKDAVNKSAEITIPKHQINTERQFLRKRNVIMIGSIKSIIASIEHKSSYAKSNTKYSK